MEVVEEEVEVVVVVEVVPRPSADIRSGAASAHLQDRAASPHLQDRAASAHLQDRAASAHLQDRASSAHLQDRAASPHLQEIGGRDPPAVFISGIGLLRDCSGLDTVECRQVGPCSALTQRRLMIG
ncbi:unnamed protein product [Boreogadus saida]